MKRTIVLALVFLMAGSTLIAQQGRYGQGNNGKGQEGALGQDLGGILGDMPVESLDSREIDGLLLMREEEKLARDVYLVLAEEWGIRSFENIARAEETHMNAVGMLFERYDLQDPVTDDEPGVFHSADLSTLYDELIDQGLSSYEDALKVGAKIEELDIADLLDLMEVTDNQDVRVVYQNLLKGSRNHLRSFAMQIDRRGASYSPEFLSSDEYKRIITSPRESGTAITDPDFLF